MQVQSPQLLCRLSADIPLLESTPVDGSPQRQDVLQERCAVQSYRTHGSTALPQLGQRGCSSPPDNSYVQRSVTTGTYYTGNVHTQHIGLAGFCVERSEKQVKYELGRLYKLLERAEKYQTYREKQPALTPAEVVARDTAERKEQDKRKSQGLQQEKDKTVWPDFLERAFWTALVRWPPMGRKKYMLEGTQRGRNELIQDSIYRDTGIRRDRKQVSSHLQVLKDKLGGVPAVLLYMATPEDVSKRRCTKMPLRAPHSSQVHGGQHAQRTESVTKPEYSTSSPHVWPHHSGPQSDLTLSSGPERDPTLSPFAVTDFKVLVDDDHQPVHCSAQMQLNGRLDSSDVVDLASWHLRYAEFGFLQSEAEDWIRSGRRILVGTASADLMTEVRPDADLTIIFDLHSHLDLSGYEHLECMTRFCNHDEIAVGSRSPPESARPYQKEARTSCEYRPDSQGSQGTLRIKFNAHPWLIQMRKHQNMRDILQGNVGGLLQRMTARQDIYGVVADTGETQCLITVLWRFKLTKSSSEVGNIEWRSISLASCEPVAEERWYQGAEYKTGNLGDMGTGHERTPVVLASTTTDVTPYYQADQLPLDLSHTYRSHRTYQTEAHHGYQPPPLSIDILGSMQSGSDHLDTSAATTATEFSRPSFASSHTPGMVSPNIHGNDFNFDSGHIVISGAFESTSNTSTYGSFLSQSAGLEDLHTLAGLDHDEFATMGISIAEHGQLFPLDASTNLHHSADPACYSAKPAWQHAHLTSHLDNGAEQFHSHLGHADHTQVARNHRSLHGCDAHQQLCQRGESLATGLHDATHSFWGVQGLQSPCQDNMSSGDVNRVEYREEQTQSSDYDVPDVVQRDPTGRSY